MKKFISVTLCFVLAFSVFAVGAFAAANADVDNDNKITAADARKILRASVGLETLSSAEKIAADIDMDGFITASDARLALRISVLLEKTDLKLHENELDVLKSGFFYADADITESGVTRNLKLAITDSSIFVGGGFFTEDLGIEGTDGLSVLVNEKDTYFINEKNKTFAPMSGMFELVGFEMGMDELQEAFEELGTDSLPELDSAASVSEESYKGEACKKYAFPSSDGSTLIIYMNGKRLAAIVSLGAKGDELIRYEFNEITLAVPSGYTAPSSSYKRISPLEIFAGFLV